MPVPEATEAFFGGDAPDDAGVVLSLDRHPAVRKWGDGSRQGYEITLADLPKHVKVLRVYNAY